ncbi:phosphoglucan phosphatase LSF1, chloroplastic-like isoform X2 [Chenopodium quinoa]|nr:phosphoglucan phosphatase LSF1, chloroplastic-like isoform X2 [Chenopodium quinoa]
MLKEKVGSFSLVLERPFSPFPIEELLSMNDLDILFNRGRVPVATWSKTLVASALQGSSESGGNSGFVVFSSKFLVSRAWKMLNGQNGNGYLLSQHNSLPASLTQLVCISVEEDSTDAEWSHGSFPLGEYTKAIDRSKGEIYYNHSLGMQYSKITEQLYVGSCIQRETDVEALASLGITALLNFQSPIEAENWGINSNSIKECCHKCDILMINYPIREGDSFDMRKKLPFSVGLLLRLLKKNHRVFVTCTSGFDRSPACVIAYLHWMMDTSLNAAYNFVTGLHTCRANRPAIAWATWDLIAMVDKDRHDRPATHAVIFVWNGHEGEDVCLVGDFTGNWKDPIKAVHKGGPRYEIEVRLPQGKYYYKYIVNGQWRHSMTSPTERDESGNVNNIIMIGDTASARPSVQQHIKDANIVKVIERQLTENERFMLAKAARCIAFSICPIRLVPK